MNEATTYAAWPPGPDQTAPRPGEVVTAEVSRELDVIMLGLLLALVSTDLWINIWSRFNLYRLDILTFYLPWYEHLGERLRDGDLPGWIPYIMSGAPFAGDPQSGWGYLPAMVSFTISPSLGGYYGFLAFHVLLAALSTYFFARIIGIGPVGAFAAGGVFTLGNFMQRTACCTIHMQVAVWIPAIFLCIELGLRSSRTVVRWRWFVLGAICTGQMVAGWVGQGAYYGGLAIGIYLAYRLLIGNRQHAPFQERIRSLVMIGAVLAVVGGSTAAPAILPRLEVVSRSNLSDLYEDDEVSSEETGWDIQEVPFRIFSLGAGSGRWYLGAISLTALVAAGVLCLRRRHALFFALFGLGALSLIIKHSPTTWLFNWLPRFESLHVHSPDRVYVVLFLAPAILIGWLIHTLVSGNMTYPRHRGAPFLAVALPVVFIATCVAIVKFDRDFWIREDLLFECGLAVAGIAVALFVPRKNVRRFAAGAVLLLVLYDPEGRLVRGRFEFPERRERLVEIVDNNIEPNGAAQWLQARAEAGEIFRFYGYDQAQLMNQGEIRTYHVSHASPETWRLLVNNRGVAFHLQDIQGYNPVQIQLYVELFDAINGVDQSYHAANVLASGISSPIIDQLNVKYIVVPVDVPPGRPDLFHLSQQNETVFADSESRILENPDALDRAWIVHDADNEETAEDILTKLSLRLTDPRRSVLLEGEELELDRPPSDAIESVVITSYQPDEIRIQVDAASVGMVVIAEIWDPDWTATIDGQSARVYRANAAFRGVLVQPGEHEIILRYKPRSLAWSLLFYFVPVFALLGLAVPLRSLPTGRSSTLDLANSTS